MTAGGAEVFLVYDERRGYDAVGGQRRGGAGWMIGNDQGEVGTAALLEAGFGCAESKAAWKQDLGCVCHEWITHLIYQVS